MGKSELGANNLVVLSGVLGAELQDRMMAAAKLAGVIPEIIITEQRYEAMTRELTLTVYEYNMEEEVWDNQGETVTKMTNRGESFHDFYWSLSVGRVYMTPGQRYKTFKDCAEIALGWEEA